MNNRRILGLGLLLMLVIAGLVVISASGSTQSLFNPKGIVALQERNLLITAVSLMLLVVIPVFGFTFFIVWRYRDSGHKARYTPEWKPTRLMLFGVWAVPAALIFTLALMTWISTHQLDPTRPIQANTTPVTIQVVALQWKWLFIYPEQNIATTNFVEFPAHTPINFELTAQAPMNSFWIPQLGGQMYAMEGMSTQVHLMANEEGEFPGLSAEISGEGFADMKFMAKATSQAEFDRWVATAQQSGNALNWDVYEHLSKPSKAVSPRVYAPVEQGLYRAIIDKYLTPAGSTRPSMSGMDEMEY